MSTESCISECRNRAGGIENGSANSALKKVNSNSSLLKVSIPIQTPSIFVQLQFQLT